jgi:hypothetical protein
MNEENGPEKKDFNDHPHASRPGLTTVLALIGLAAAAIIWFLGGFG